MFYLKFKFLILSFLVLGTASCGDSTSDNDNDTTGEPDTVQNSDIDTVENDSAQVPGKSADGWKSAWSDEGVRISCDDNENALANAPSLTFEETSVYIGYEQVGDNQNPLLIRFDNGEQIYCVKHETEGPDGRVRGITWDGGDTAYLVYSIVGGGTSLEGKGGWLSSYAPGAISGGGASVSVAGRVSMNTGTLETATFIIAVLSSNKVNTHNPAAPLTVMDDGSVEFLGESAHKPIGADGKSWMDCTDYPFNTRYHFTSDLTELLCADSTNCKSQNPCK